jgi:hypothetical protein
LPITFRLQGLGVGKCFVGWLMDSKDSESGIDEFLSLFVGDLEAENASLVNHVQRVLREAKVSLEGARPAGA